MTHVASVNELVVRWQELRDQGRTVSVEDLCADFPELLDDVKRRLQALASMEQFLGAASEDTLGATPARTGDPAGTDQTPPAIPGYEVLGVLGRGGMGVVYRARQRGLDRPIALKMILAGAHASPQELARFRTEARAAARLQHRNIVQIHEVGEWRAEGVSPPIPYFSLEYCAGGSLQKRLDGTPLAPLEAAVLVEQLAGAIHTAHQAGVIHRDLKPANVLLTADGTPKIADFGLAKRMASPGCEAGENLTQSGAVVGTPSYMAPEQAGGTKGVVGPAADVYALGAVLYECLTGRPPFKADTPWDTLRQVIHDQPVPPRQLNAKVPRNLEIICLKCLHKEPYKRYPSAAGLADDLRRFLDGRPITARAVGRGERLWLWARRQPARAAAYALLAVAMLLGGGGGSAAWLWQRAERGWHEAAQAHDDLAREMAQTELARRGEQQARERLDHATYGQAIGLALACADRDAKRARRLLADCPMKLRGWEWDYVDRLCRAEPPIYRGHMAPIRHVAFSPDGTALASADELGVVRVWDLRTQRELSAPAKIPGAGSVYGLTFSPDGTRIASSHRGGTVRVWETRTGHQLFSRAVPMYEAQGLAFSADGTQLACAGSWLRGGGTPTDGEVKILDAASGQELAAFAAPELALKAVAFRSNGQVVAAGADLRREGEVTFERTSCGLIAWDRATGKATSVLPGRLYNCTRPAFSADGKLVGGACRDWVVRVWDAESGEEQIFLPGHTGIVFGIAFSPDGRRLVSGAGDRTVRLWDLIAQKELVARQGPSSIFAVACSPDGKQVAGGSQDKTVQVWSATGGPEAVYLPESGAERPVFDLAFTSDGRSLIAARAQQVEWYDLAAGRLVASRAFGTTAPHQGALALSRDGRRYAGPASDKQVKVWDVETGQAVCAVDQDPQHLARLALSSDGRLLAVANLAGDLKVWDTKTEQPVLSLPKLGHSLESLAFSPDGKRLAGGNAWWIKVWGLASGREEFQSEGHRQPVVSLAFSSDGQRLASGSHDGTAKMWHLATGSAVTLSGHAFYVEQVVFMPRGDRVVTGSRDGSIKLWDAVAGLENLSLHARGHVRCLAVSGDGRRIAAGRDGLLTVWDASAVQERADLRQKP